MDHEGVDPGGFAVVWEIEAKPGQSYRFADPGGIEFKTAQGQRAFVCHTEANATRYRCKGDRDGTKYDYGIRLVGSPPVSKLDPWIVNR